MATIRTKYPVKSQPVEEDPSVEVFVEPVVEKVVKPKKVTIPTYTAEDIHGMTTDMLFKLGRENALLPDSETFIQAIKTELGARHIFYTDF